MKPEDELAAGRPPGGPEKPDPNDEVAALIRLAGRRPAVPAAAAARVRAATHEHWRRELRQRGRVRALWAAGLAAAAALALVIGWQAARSEAPAAGGEVRVEALAGEAWSRQGRLPWDRRRPLVVGASVPAGAELGTAAGGRLAVRLASGHSVRLDARSRVRVLGRAELALDQGAVYVDSGAPAPASRAPGSRFEPLRLRTRLGEVHETGTQYEVRLGEESVRIRVREGEVVLEAGDRRHAVGTGIELLADGRGGVRTREIAPRGEDWDWAVDIAPLPTLDGLTARAFLDRVAREGGWTLRFADGEAARLAGEAVLRGTVGGLTPEQALAAVLPTCGLVHRFEGGDLVVGRAG